MSGWIPRVGRLFDVIVRWKMSDVFGGPEVEGWSRSATEVSSLLDKLSISMSAAKYLRSHQEVSIPRTTIFLR